MVYQDYGSVNKSFSFTAKVIISPQNWGPNLHFHWFFSTCGYAPKSYSYCDHIFAWEKALIWKQSQKL